MTAFARAFAVVNDGTAEAGAETEATGDLQEGSATVDTESNVFVEGDPQFIDSFLIHLFQATALPMHKETELQSISKCQIFRTCPNVHAALPDSAVEISVPARQHVAAGNSNSSTNFCIHFF